MGGLPSGARRGPGSSTARQWEDQGPVAIEFRVHRLALEKDPAAVEPVERHDADATKLPAVRLPEQPIPRLPLPGDPQVALGAQEDGRRQGNRGDMQGVVREALSPAMGAEGPPEGAVLEPD